MGHSFGLQLSSVAWSLFSLGLPLKSMENIGQARPGVFLDTPNLFSIRKLFRRRPGEKNHPRVAKFQTAWRRGGNSPGYLRVGHTF